MHGRAGHRVAFLQCNFSRPKFHAEDNERGIEVSAMIFCICDGMSAICLRSAGRSALTGCACREYCRANAGPSPAKVEGAILAEWQTLPMTSKEAPPTCLAKSHSAIRGLSSWLAWPAETLRCFVVASRASSVVARCRS